MKNNKGKYLSIQQTERFPSPVSSQWKPGDNSGREGSHRFSSYQSIPSSSNSGNSMGHFANSSIRNSAHSSSTALCLQQFRWCVACYESKFIMIEPVIFIVMFAVYMHKIVFELYTFTTFAKRSIGRNESLSNRSCTCISTTALNNVTLMESEYDVDGLLWSNKTGDIVEANTGILMMVVNIVLGIFSVFGTLVLGPLSNRFGRKPALAAILGGMLAQVLLTSLIVQYSLNVHFFILGAMLRGITGGVAGVYTVLYSYITEFGRNRKKWLVLRIGVIETLSFVAVALGLIFGGVGVDFLKCDFRIPAYIVLGCILCAFIYSVIATADSRHHTFATSANQSPLPQKEPKVHIGPVALVKGARMFVTRGYPRLKLWLSLLVMVVTVLNSSGMTAIITLFLLHRPLVWGPLYIGGFLGMSEFLHGIVLVVVLPVLLLIGIHDGTIVTMSVLLTISMNITLAFADHTWHVFLVGIIQSAEVLIVPTLKAMLSKSVPAQERGALFTLISIAQILSTILGSALYIPLYIMSLNEYWPHPPGHASGAPFLLMAMVYVVTIPLMCGISLSDWLEKRRKRLEGAQRTNTSPPLSSAYPSTDRPTSPLLSDHPPPGLDPRHSFEVSIGQDVADKVASLQEERRNRDLLVQSYSSLSDYHSNKQ